MTIRASTSTQIANTLGATITGVKPTGSVAGDRLLAWVVQDTVRVHTGPSGEGWTKLADANTAVPADTQTGSLWEKKVSDGAETFAFTSNGTHRAIIQVFALTGRHATAAATVSTPTIQNTPLSSPISVGLSGLTVADGDDILWLCEMDHNSNGDTWSVASLSGYTNLQNDSNANYITSASFAKENVTAGATGTLTATATRTAGTSTSAWSGVVVAIPTGASGPTVTSVTQTSGGTEGSPAVMTVSLSGATSGSTNFAATLAGVTATGAGTDFTSDLASATYSNGVTFSGGNMVVPDAVSGWTVTIATTGDTLDEANETATLTVGGTAGTLTITDDDAAPTITGTASSTVTAGDPVVITYSPGLSGQTRTYTLAFTDGTAVGGTDYDNTTVTGDFAVTAGTGSVSISGSTVTVDAGVTEFTLTITTTA